jgi:hypothetical protein
MRLCGHRIVAVIVVPVVMAVEMLVFELFVLVQVRVALGRVHPAQLDY